MTFAFAGVASAQSSSQSSQSSQGSSGSSGGTGGTGGTIGGSSAARTGMDTWIPLLVGGMVITIAVATRVGLSRAAART